MDKADFIRLAPDYYKLAVVLVLREERGYVPSFSLKSKYYERHPDSTDPDDGYSLLENDALLQLAIDTLVKEQVIDALLDPFGPSQFRAGEGLGTYIDENLADASSPLHKAEASGDAERWLRAALERLNKIGAELEVTADDWQQPEAEWEPIPIERDNEAFLRAEAAVDHAIKEVEQNNGYASAHPEERNFVLEKLKLLSARFKSAKDISIGYVRANGVEALRKISHRFGNAAVGKVADAAITALLTWLGLK